MKKSLRIIIVMLEPPLPFGNAAARWFYVLLKGLINRGHEVTVFATCANPADIDRAQQLFPDCDLRCFTHPRRGGLGAKLETLWQPYSYVFSAEFKQQLKQELAKPFDVLHLEQVWSGWLGLDRSHKSFLNVHFLHVIDRGLPQTQQWLTERAEAKILRAYPNLITLSDRLGTAIHEISPKSHIDILPLGIDLSLYPFMPKSPDRTSSPVVGLIGSFNWTPTYAAAERLITKLWQPIKQQIPNAKLLLVGRSAKSVLAKFGDIPDAEIHENVPDTLPYFQQLDAMVYAPRVGSGMKVKVMEAFALGIPVVTTPDGVEGLPARDRVHGGICLEDRDLIDRTVEILKSSTTAQQYRQAARQMLEATCSPEIVLDKLEAIYTKKLGKELEIISKISIQQS
jgi:polysaccharide biosynthesis protein PslH